MQGNKSQHCNKTRHLLQVSIIPSVSYPLSHIEYRSCFVSLVQTRFKRSLEPFVNPQPDGPRRKALEAAGSLVIGFSGGTCSTALLDLVAKTYFAPRSPATKPVKGGKSHPRNAERRVWRGKPVVCYVEVCGAFPDVRFSILILKIVG